MLGSRNLDESCCFCWHSTRIAARCQGVPFARIEVPSPRERPHDVSVLAPAFAPATDLDLPALHLVKCYVWPSNSAELRSVMERAVALAPDAPIEERHLPEHVRYAPLPGIPIRLP